MSTKIFPYRLKRRLKRNSCKIPIAYFIKLHKIIKPDLEIRLYYFM